MSYLQTDPSEFDLRLAAAAVVPARAIWRRRKTGHDGFAIAALIEVGLWLAGIAIIIGIVWAAWHSINYWHNAAYFEMEGERDAVVVQRDALQAEKAAAQARATAMALLWDQERQKGERDARTRQEILDSVFVPVHRALRDLSDIVARVRFPGAAARVLDDAISAGNAATARPSGEPAKDPATTAATTGTADAAVDVGQVTAWGVAVSALYAACVDQVRGWQSFYSGLRMAQPAEAK